MARGPVIEPTLKVINALEREGVIGRYAIGGGFAVLFYAEPVLTYDLDVFVFIQPARSGLIDLTRIYDRLRRLGYRALKEHVIIESVPVQFLPPYNALVLEAIEDAVEARVGRTKTRVFRAEHLAAVLLQTGRRKDRERLSLLLEEARINMKSLRRILARYGLVGKWEDLRP